MTLSSARSTLSMYTRKATKYQKLLNLSNVFLLITSTVLIFSSIILMKFYHLMKLDFWSDFFWITPALMMGLGLYTFLICIYGILISGSENRGFIAFFAFLLILAFVGQLVSIFTALELRTIVAQSSLGATLVHDDLKLYNESPAIKAKWDDLQRDLHCCGGNNFLTGFNDYLSTPLGSNHNSVPDSCCHKETKDCGKGIFIKSEADARNTIFVDGCIEIVKDKLNDDVIPMMVVYACIGVILAISEMITAVLACAYVAQISRRIKREEETGMWRHANANDENDHEMPLNHETVC